MEMKTELRQIADRLGLGEYPEALEAVYEAQKGSTAPACDLALIDSLQETYDLFGEFYDLVKETAMQINADPDLNTYVRAAAQFHKENDKATATKLPVPNIGDSPVMNFMMLHIMMPLIPESFVSLEKRGFTWEEMEDNRRAYKSGIAIVKRQTGHPGINRTYFSWQNLYCRAMIYKVAGFWFEIKQFPTQALWLRNRQTKQVVPLMKGTFFRDGSMQLGAKNYEDPEGSFVTEYTEDEENFYGYGCVDNIVSREKQTWPKSLWECVARPGEYCLSLHIPRNADVSTEGTMKACRIGLQIARERFPEYGKMNCVFCASWLLNPRLKEIQGPQSRITQFEECFVKYPNKDTTGGAVFSFVYVRKPADLNDLEENTSLQRKLKKMYIEGDCIHTYSGAIFMEE